MYPIMKKFFQKVGNWELWPFDLIYAPVSIVWLYYSLKARSLYFFTPSNPTLLFGGFEAGSKMEMYRQLPEGSYPKTILISPAIAIDNIKNAEFHWQVNKSLNDIIDTYNTVIFDQFFF